MLAATRGMSARTATVSRPCSAMPMARPTQRPNFLGGGEFVTRVSSRGVFKAHTQTNMRAQQHLPASHRIANTHKPSNNNNTQFPLWLLPWPVPPPVVPWLWSPPCPGLAVATVAVTGARADSEGRESVGASSRGDGPEPGGWAGRHQIACKHVLQRRRANGRGDTSPTARGPGQRPAVCMQGPFLSQMSLTSPAAPACAARTSEVYLTATCVDGSPHLWFRGSQLHQHISQ